MTNRTNRWRHILIVFGMATLACSGDDGKANGPATLRGDWILNYAEADTLGDTKTNCSYKGVEITITYPEIGPLGEWGYRRNGQYSCVYSYDTTFVDVGPYGPGTIAQAILDPESRQVLIWWGEFGVSEWRLSGEMSEDGETMSGDLTVLLSDGHGQMLQAGYGTWNAERSSLNGNPREP